jgi:Flp pilus assembly protein TadD
LITSLVDPASWRALGNEFVVRSVPENPMSRWNDKPASLAASMRAKDRQPFLLAALLAGVTFFVYAQTWQFGFITVDDPFYVSENPHIQQGLTLPGLTWSFTAVHDGNWIPLTWLSLMLDTSLYGIRPGGYHLTNVFLHIASALLLFAALVVATGSQPRSAFVAALFAIHPLHVESVAWIAERKDVLSTFFGLLSLFAYVRFAKTGKFLSLATSVLCLVGSLLSKQTLVTLPFVFLLLDFWPLGRLRVVGVKQPSVARLLGEKIPFFAASVAFSVIAMFAQSRGGAVMDRTHFPLSERALNAVLVYAAYLGKIFWPGNLAVYYPHPHEALSLTAVGLAGALLLAISAAAIACVRRYPYLFVGWCWYLGTLVPMIGLVQIGAQQMADRYTYFPVIGIFLAVTWLACDLTPVGARGPRILKAAAGQCLVLLAILSYRQVGFWHDSVTLLRHSKDSTVDNFRAHQLLGSALVAEGNKSEGVAELETAVRMGDSSPAAHSALGIGLQESGRLDEAAEQYRAALALSDRDPDVYSNLGLIQLKRREYPAAKENFLRAVQLDPEHAKAYTGLATACLETGDYRQALASSQRALTLDSRSVRARHDLAVALVALGRLDEAIRQFQYLVAMLPDDLEARQNLARALEMKNRPAQK